MYLQQNYPPAAEPRHDLAWSCEARIEYDPKTRCTSPAGPLNAQAFAAAIARGQTDMLVCNAAA
jgi:hypothetical protein